MINNMKCLKICAALAVALNISSAHAVDNTTLKNTVILTGLITNTFAIHYRDQFKPCDQVWQFGYQDTKDVEMHAQTARVGWLRCDMDTTDVLPYGITFSVLPTVLGSVWKTDSGPYNHGNQELALVPVGQFGLNIGPVILDASFGFGPSLIQHTTFGSKNKSTHYQFSDEMGVGISDAKRRMRLDFTYRHISNADLKKPNNGMNFVGVGFTYSLN